MPPNASSRTGLQLAKEPGPILEKFREATRQSDECRRSGRAAVMAAREVGQMLARVKRCLGNRKFAPWMRQTFGTQMSIDTADRWIKLSAAHVQQIEGCEGLRQAYIALGILPQPHRTEPEPDQGFVDVYKTTRSRVLEAVKRVRKVLAEAPLDQLPIEQREALRAEIEPLADVFRALGIA